MEPLQEFLADQGFKTLLNRLVSAGVRPRRPDGAAAVAASMTS